MLVSSRFRIRTLVFQQGAQSNASSRALHRALVPLTSPEPFATPGLGMGLSLLTGCSRRAWLWSLGGFSVRNPRHKLTLTAEPSAGRSRRAFHPVPSLGCVQLGWLLILKCVLHSPANLKARKHFKMLFNVVLQITYCGLEKVFCTLFTLLKIQQGNSGERFGAPDLCL